MQRYFWAEQVRNETKLRVLILQEWAAHGPQAWSEAKINPEPGRDPEQVWRGDRSDRVKGLPRCLGPGPLKSQLLPPAWPGAAFVPSVLEPLSQQPCFTHALHYEHKSPAEIRSRPPGLWTVSKVTGLSLTSPDSWLWSKMFCSFEKHRSLLPHPPNPFTWFLLAKHKAKMSSLSSATFVKTSHLIFPGFHIPHP